MEVIVWDIQNHEFLKTLTNSQKIEDLNWKLRDHVAVQLSLVTPDDTTGTYDAQAAPTGWAVKFTAKAADSLDGAALVEQLTWTYDAVNERYEATINLNTAELIAAFEAAATDEYEIIAEFTLEDISGANRDTTQIALKIKEDVRQNTGGAGTTDAATPWFEEYIESGVRRVRLRNSDGEILADWGPPGA
jgi:hypothetical protein